MSRVAFTELRPGDARDAGWLNGILTELETDSALIARANFRPAGLRQSAFGQPPSYEPYPAQSTATAAASAWPVAWGTGPAEVHVSLGSFTLPGKASLRMRLGFDFLNTIAAGVVTVPGVPAGKLAEWRIGFSVDGTPDYDLYSQSWMKCTANAVSGSGYTEAWLVNRSASSKTINYVQSEFRETSGATIHSGYSRLQAAIFRRCV